MINYWQDVLTDSFDTSTMDPSPTPTATFNLPNSCSSNSGTPFSSVTQEPAISFALDQKYNAARAHYPSSDYGFEQIHQQPRMSAAQNSNEPPLASPSCSLGNGPSASTSFQLPCVSDTDTNLHITSTTATITDIPVSFYNSFPMADTNSTDYGSGSKVSTTFSPQSSKLLTNEDPLDLDDVFDDFELARLETMVIPIDSQTSSGLYLNNKRVSKTKPKTITVVDLTNDDAEHTYEVSVTDGSSSPSNATTTNTSVNHRADLLAPASPPGNNVTSAAQSVDITVPDYSSPFYSCQEESGQAMAIEPSFSVSAPSSSASQTFGSTSSSFDTTSSSSSIVNTPPKLRILSRSELNEQTQPESLNDMIHAYLPSQEATTSSRPQPPPTANNQWTVHWPARKLPTDSYPQTTMSGLQSPQISTTSSATSHVYGTLQPTYSYGHNLPRHLVNPDSIMKSGAIPPNYTNYTENLIRQNQQSVIRGTNVRLPKIHPPEYYVALATNRTNTDPVSSTPSSSSSSCRGRLPRPSELCRRLRRDNYVTPRYPWCCPSAPPTSEPNLSYYPGSSTTRVQCPGYHVSTLVSKASFPTVRQPVPSNASSNLFYPDTVVPESPFTPSLTNTGPSAIASPNQNVTIFANKVNIQNATGQENPPMTTAFQKHSSNTLPGKTDNDGDGECVVCLENSASMVLYKCGHACLCEECVVKVKREGSKCPICRNVFKDAIKLYKV